MLTFILRYYPRPEQIDVIDEDLIELQKDKIKLASSTLSSLESVFEPQVLAFVHEGLRHLSLDQIQMAEKITKKQEEQKKQKKIDEMISIEIEKQNSISDLLNPLQNLIPPEMIKIVNASLKEVAIVESEKGVNTENK